MLVDQVEQATRHLELNTAAYSPGIYFIRFRTCTGMVIKKFVKL